MANIRNIILSVCTILSMNIYAEVSFTGNSMPVFTETPAASTGLNKIYVLYSTQGVTASYVSKNNNPDVKWYQYGSSGGGYAQEINNIEHDGIETKLENIIPNSGYIIEDGTDREYFWIVNYADYYLQLNGISFTGEAECDVMSINMQGSGPEIAYYTINGQHKVLSRELKLDYSTLEWNSDSKSYKSVSIEKEEDDFKETIALQVPYCNTTFKITGDRFLTYWNKTETIVSDLYSTQAVQVQATANQTNKGDGNTDSTLGGSAPADIEFDGFLTDAVVFKEWQISSDQDFEKILYRFSDQNINYTFNEAGTFYVRFYGANEAGSCDSYSETFQVSIGESSLKCPNAFSPQSSPGINDEWKVTYKSIISFECHIFNRWGIEMISFTDPSKGWDGKYKGKYVNSGVYFYVIQAKGADGKQYKLKGDINIINLKK